MLSIANPIYIHDHPPNDTVCAPYASIARITLLGGFAL